MPFPKPWTDPAHVGDFFNFLPFGLSSLGCTMNAQAGERAGQEVSHPGRAGGRAAGLQSSRMQQDREGKKKKKKRESRAAKRKEKKKKAPDRYPINGKTGAPGSPLGVPTVGGAENEPGDSNFNSSTTDSSGAERALRVPTSQPAPAPGRLVHLAAGAP